MNTSGVQRYFREVAEQWDELRAGFFDERVIHKALEKAPLTGHETVVDIGTGTGFVASGLAQVAQTVIGIDESADMLAVARRKMRQRGLPHVHFAQGSMEQVPLREASVDAVFGNMVLHHAPRPWVAIAELVRILRPGGTFALTDMDQHDHEWMREEMSDLWLGFPRDQMGQWLASAGLEEVAVEDVGSC